jgi:hypothetical protein
MARKILHPIVEVCNFKWYSFYNAMPYEDF